MAHPSVANGISQSEAHVLLTEHLVEALGTKTAVERLVGDRLCITGGRHPRSLPVGRCDPKRPVAGATARLAAAHEACPLRAAAFRP